MKTPMEHEREPSYGDLAAFIRRGVGWAFVAALLGGVSAYVLSSRVAPTYEARASLLIAEPNPELRALAGGVVTPSQVDVSVYQAAATTDGVLAGALERVGVVEPSREDLRAFERRLDVAFDETRVSSLLHIRVRSRDAPAAADEANALAASLLAWDGQRARSSVGRVVDTLEAQVRGLEEQIAALRTGGGAIEEIDERVALREAQRSQLALARALQTRTIGLLEFFEAARPPLEPIAPRALRDAALAAAAAALLVYALLLVRGAVDGRFATVEDLARGAGLGVLATFPPQRRGSRRMPREATSYLRTNLQLATRGALPLVVVITAPDRTTPTFGVSLSLAESFARNGQRTLLIDSDLRKSMPRRGPGIDHADVGVNEPSLREHLEHPESPIRATSIDIGVDASLDLIASVDPAPYPAELLSRSFGRLLERFEGSYDVIVIDSAPVLSVADPLVLASHATGIVVVASMAEVTRPALRQALERLEPVRTNVLGVVATDVERSRAARAGRDAHDAPDELGASRARVRGERRRPKAKPELRHR